jgi:uncharacterized membrane protein YdjX (TVP38/TMEM64 family)
MAASISFFLARYLFREKILEIAKKNPKFQAGLPLLHCSTQPDPFF